MIATSIGQNKIIFQSFKQIQYFQNLIVSIMIIIHSRFPSHYLLLFLSPFLFYSQFLQYLSCESYGRESFIIILLKSSQNMHQFESLKISIEELQAQYEGVCALGEGNSGKVYLYRRKKPTGEGGDQVALKIVKTNRGYKRAETLGEIQILKRLDHHRIVKVLLSSMQIFKYYDEKFSAYGGQRRYEIGLLLQRGRGSLQHYVKDRSYRYDFADILRFIVKFIELGAYLESQEIVHRDIKPGNIIVFGEGLEFKLGDFGLSCKVYDRPIGFAGTPAYCSPGLKKFWKEGDHGHRPPTNAYKDDVYSFALTSEEVIKHRFSLDDCPKEITMLLDEMLRHDEHQRPTFTHLLNHETVQKYLAENPSSQALRKSEGQEEDESEMILIPSIPQAYTRKKVIGGQYNQLAHHTEKSRKGKDQTITCKLKSQQSIFCGRGVRTLCSLSQQYLIAGTIEGKLFIFDRERSESTELTLSHENYVAKVTTDSNGDVWSAGGDGKIYFLSRQQLMKCIHNNRTTIPSKKRSFLFNKDKPSPPPTSIIVIPNESYHLVAQFRQDQFISDIFCQDVRHFAVGFCSGAVNVRWGKRQARTYRIHWDPITALRVSKDVLYSGDFGGLVKAYELEKGLVSKAFYKFSSQMIDFSVSEMEQGRNIEAIGSRGQLQTINLFKSLRTTFNEQLPVKNLVGVVSSSKYYYMLSADGQLFFKNRPFLKLDGTQWSCLTELGEGEVAVGSLGGEVRVVTLE